MKFRLIKTSDPWIAFEERYKHIKYIEFNTLEELMKWQRGLGEEIILFQFSDGEPVIEIYDGYRE